MKKYEVKVSLRYTTDFVVEANDVYEANAKAENLAGQSYTVYNPDNDQHYSFDYITAYDPEEIN